MFTYLNQHLNPILVFVCRLVHDRELCLYDGTRLLHHERYRLLKEKMQITDQEMETRYSASYKSNVFY